MKHFAFLCLGVALLAACRKDDVIVCDSVTATTSSFADIRTAAPAVQTFSFALGQAQSFQTMKGATVAFSANAFILPNGNVATGQAQLKLREIYSVPDMVLADMPTTAQSSRQMLVSGGEFRIQVWQGSTRLRMPSASATSAINRLILTSPQPTAGLDTTQMLLWKLPANPLAGTPSDSSGWQLSLTAGAIPSAPSSPTRVYSAAGYYSVAVPLDSISNWNIDQFWHAYQNSPSGYIGVEVPAGATTTRVYFRPVGFNGLARSYAGSSSPTRHESYLPLGASVTAVVVQERNGQLYYGTQALTTAANAVVTPTLQALSSAEIVQRIRQL